MTAEGRRGRAHGTEAAVQLLTDLAERPAEVLDRHGDAITELAAMRGCPQPANHHAEGDVWAHTALALAVFADRDQAIERHAGPALRAAGLTDLGLPPPSATQALAVLLHDVGKPVTIADDDGLTYYGHEAEGARLVGVLADRLGLAGAARAIGLDIDLDEVAWLVADHLFWLNTDVDAVTDRALARRYLRDDGWGDDLRVLHWCDTLGSRGPEGTPYVDLVVAAEARIAAFRAAATATAAAPPPLLDGHAVMTALGLPPGPEVGAVLAGIRAAARTEDQARALLDEEAARRR